MTNFEPFYAAVSPKALDKATRLFNATLEDIFNELIQNARRAGASASTCAQRTVQAEPWSSFVTTAAVSPIRKAF